MIQKQQREIQRLMVSSQELRHFPARGLLRRSPWKSTKGSRRNGRND